MSVSQTQSENIQFTLNATKRIILLRSFCLYISYNSGPPIDVGSYSLFCAGCTTCIHKFAYSFCCVGYFGGVNYGLSPSNSFVYRMFQACRTGWSEGLFSFLYRCFDPG